MIFTPYEQFQGLLKVGEYEKAYVLLSTKPSEIVEQITYEDANSFIKGNKEDWDLMMSIPSFQEKCIQLKVLNKNKLNLRSKL